MKIQPKTNSIAADYMELMNFHKILIVEFCEQITRRFADLNHRNGAKLEEATNSTRVHTTVGRYWQSTRSCRY